MIEIADGLSLPIEAGTKTFAALGMRESGKTYCGQKLAEEMYDAGIQIVVFDCVGNWHNLRIDGTGKGLAIPVFGGQHGDVPLEVGSGVFIAKLIVEQSLSVVLDVMDFRKSERKRFMADFVDEFFHLKKRRPSPVHVFIEEAHLLVPQSPGPDEARMVGAIEDLVRVGRNYGIGVSLFDQRAASVNKNVLTQCECLLAFQTTSSQDRLAITKWIDDHRAEGGDELKRLPKLEKGECFFYSPGWLRTFRLIRIAKKRTFDGSKTPTVGGRATVPRKLAPVEIEEIRAAMAATIEKAAADDPKALRRRVAELEKQLSARPAPKVEQKRVEVPALAPADLQRLERAVDRYGEIVDKGAQAQQVVVAELDQVRDALRAIRAPVPLPLVRGARVVQSPRLAARAPLAGGGSSENGAGRLPPGEAATLAALIQYPNGLMRSQLTVITGYKRSTRDAYIFRLKERGFAEVADDRVRATGEGITALPNCEPLPIGRDLQEFWLRRLPSGEGAVLQLALDSWPKSVARDSVSERTGFKRSTRDAYIHRLVAKEIVQADSAGVRASDSLFSDIR